jgi:WD40 repeat protein
MLRTPLPVTVLAVLVLALSGPATRAADGPEPAGDLEPITPVSQLRLFNFRNYGPFDGSVALAPDGKTLAWGNNNSLQLYDVFKPRQPFQQPRHVILENFYFQNSPLTFLPNGKTVAALPAQHIDDASIRFWDVTTGKEVRELDNDQPFFGMAVSPDGKLLALGAPQRIELWDAATSDDVRMLNRLAPPNGGPYRALAFSPDGRMLAAAATGAEVELWEVASGQVRQQLRLTADTQPAGPNVGYRGTPAGPVAALAFSANGTLLASGGDDRAIHVWNLLTGEELPPLVGHQAAVRALVFTPDGKDLVSFDAEGLRLTWRVARIARAHVGTLPSLSDDDFDDLWNDLAEGDAFRFYRATRYLTAEPRRALALLGRRLRPVPPGDPARLAQLTADLRSPNAAQRRKAMGELRKQGEAALGALTPMAKGPPYNRAVQGLIRKLEAQVSPTERARSLRAVRILEQIGTADARRLLETLAKGAAGAKLTEEAKAASQRLAGASRHPGKSSSAAVESRDPDALWADLAAEDAGRAWRAIRPLVADPRKAGPLLRAHLKPVPPTDPRQIDRLVADLDSDDFQTRQRAAAALENLGAQAEAALKKALEGQPSPEARRQLVRLVERLGPGHAPAANTLRGLRALEVLERLGPDEQKPILDALASGAPQAPLTQEARAALDRLAKRSTGSR